MKRTVKGDVTAKMKLEDVFCNFTPQFHSSSSNTSIGFVDVDEFFVDQLLNLNNSNNDSNNNDNDDDEVQPLETPHFEHQQQQPQQQQQQQRQRQRQQQNEQEADEVKDAAFLSPPLDTAEEADLEWLSHFVDDSSCPYSTPFPPGYVCPKPELEPKSKPKPALSEAVPVSLKRARRRNRVWARPEPTSSTSLAPKQEVRKGSWPGHQRRCSHCGAQKTPQWRAGPSGEKTLCNACGVRFKSGRLLPEYRPACSPSFSSKLHSNSHRKVMEMRMKKKEDGSEPQFGLFHHVSSFG
ncbi:hypothetical protein vseg_019503 [Gypsophila vaccaria]